jgi:hypothetical protein
MRDEHKMFEITKLYDETSFPDNEMSIGYMINVYQESINKIFPEYLVNFDYFVRMMENYGFVLLTKEEAEKKDLPNGSGLFSELYTHMEKEIDKNAKRIYDYGTANQMNLDEKWVSFMNRYFIFRKNRHVDSEKVYNQFINKMDKVEHPEDIVDVFIKPTVQTKDVDVDVDDDKEKTVKEEKPVKVRNLKKKLVLDDYLPFEESMEPSNIVLGDVVKIKKQKK